MDYYAPTRRMLIVGREDNKVRKGKVMGEGQEW